MSNIPTTSVNTGATAAYSIKKGDNDINWARVSTSEYQYTLQEGDVINLTIE